MTQTQWTVLGAGSLGCLWGGYLSRAGFDITLIHRSGVAAPDSLSLTRFQSKTAEPFKAKLSCAEHCAPGSIKQLIIATKAPDALDAVAGIAHALADDATILVLQNGMGAQQAVADAYSNYAIIAACITDGAYRTEPGHVIHAGQGLSRIGALNEKGKTVEQDVIAQLMQMDLVIEACPEINQALWNKLAINIAINGLTALDQCLNGELNEPQRLKRVERLCQETEAVMKALNLTLPEQGVFDLARSVIDGTAQNRSSMLQDTLKGKSTEIEYINGYLLQQANKLGIAAPENQTVYEAVIARFH
ncbi:ketopantoate reductase family protein [Oceanospirillum beijerinckii]|uniref:ketopantoate reductase family protein n=1 Tax=Oceanospirillum beijerinckii TaxID=64976 RepID=UPI000429C3A9|nr:2-dehydropantoate 2-reductase [Oceanospirillum beijerinckii]